MSKLLIALMMRYKFTDVLEVLAAMSHRPDDGGSKDL
jgi:hypothetical protein